MALLPQKGLRRFRHIWRKENLPGWLKDGDGGGILYTIGSLLDYTLERARQGLLSRFPTYAPPDALPLMGQDRRIVRGLNEPDESYAARLKEWRYPYGHRTRGNPFALMRQIRAYFAYAYPVRVRTVDVRGNWYTIDFDGTESYLLDQGDWDWDGAPATPRWGRFWVIIYTPDTLPDYYTQKWGDPGRTWGEPGRVWGRSPITSRDTRILKSLCRYWRPAGTIPEWLIWTPDTSMFIPGVTGETDGTWHYARNRTGKTRFARIGV